MKKLIISLAVLIVTGLSLSGCLKETKSPSPGFDVGETGINSTVILEVPLDVYLQADRAIRSQRDSIIAKNINQPTYNFTIGYINLTVSPADTTTYPKTIVLDFGTDTQKTYQGKMTIMMNGNMRIAGSKCAISYLGLQTGASVITGKDTIISSGINSSGSIVSRFNIHEGELMGNKDGKITYDGRIIAKYNLTSKTNVMDSVELNAVDVNLVGYKVHSVPTYKLQITKSCNFFSTGLINSEIRLNNVLTGNMIFDFGYNAQGTLDACDGDGAVFIYSKVNPSFQAQYAFTPKEFL